MVCPPLVESQGTIITPDSCLVKNARKVGDKCSFSCNAGYELPDPSRNTMTCLDTAQWDRALLYCQRKWYGVVWCAVVFCCFVWCGVGFFVVLWGVLWCVFFVVVVLCGVLWCVFFSVVLCGVPWCVFLFCFVWCGVVLCGVVGNKDICRIFVNFHDYFFFCSNTMQGITTSTWRLSLPAILCYYRQPVWSIVLLSLQRWIYHEGRTDIPKRLH